MHYLRKPILKAFSAVGRKRIFLARLELFLLYLSANVRKLTFMVRLTCIPEFCSAGSTPLKNTSGDNKLTQTCSYMYRGGCRYTDFAFVRYIFSDIRHDIGGVRFSVVASLCSPIMSKCKLKQMEVRETLQCN